MHRPFLFFSKKNGFCDATKWQNVTFFRVFRVEKFLLVVWSSYVKFKADKIMSSGLTAPKRMFTIHYSFIKNVIFVILFILLEARTQFSKCSRVTTSQYCLISIFWPQTQHPVIKIRNQKVKAQQKLQRFLLDNTL